MKRQLFIGIDPGTHTGIAIWDKTSRRLEVVDTMSITKAMEIVKANVELIKSFGGEVVVFFEDARNRSWFGHTSRERLQGAGSVKRDCSIWETFCEELGVEYRKVAPKHNTTKLTAAQFKVLTNWQGRTSEHGRDAAMLIFGR